MSYIFETLAIGLYVYAREPEDCFNCYNRIPTIKYSQFAGVPPIVGGRVDEVERDGQNLLEGYERPYSNNN